MNFYIETKIAAVGVSLLVAFGVAATAVAQDTLVALGRVESTGTLSSSQNTVGGIVASVRNATGDFTITVDAVGAFAGAAESDFVVELTIASSAKLDDIAKSDVTVTDDQLTIDVRVNDLEDPGMPNDASAQNRDFFFVVRRIPSGAATVAGGTRYLKALGVVSSTGTLLSGYGLDGITVTSVRNSVGEYVVTLTKTGAYAADTSTEHLIMLTPIGGNTQDQVLNGTASVSSADSVEFDVICADVQTHLNGNTVDFASNTFSFVAYQLVGGGGVPDSQFLTALANVRGSDGLALKAVGAQAGMVVNSTRSGEGDYRVTVTDLGAFAGLSDNDFVAQVTLRQTGVTDQSANVAVTVANDDTLHVDVNTNDLEESGQAQGLPSDANFALALYSVDPLVSPDLRIGNKKMTSTQKGDGIINTTGSIQRIKVKLVERKKERFYFTVQNDGNVIDDLGVTEVGATRKFLKTKYFDIQSGGRTNISAIVRTGGEAVSDLRPGKSNRFEVQAKSRKLQKRPKQKLRISGASIHSPADADTVAAKIVVGS